MNKLISLIMLALLLTGASCPSKKTDNSSANGAELEKTAASELIGIINAFNESAPDTVTAAVLIEADIKNQKYKATGQASFDRNADILNLTLQDAIFKTTIFNFLEDNNKLYFYYPPEKHLLIDNPDKVNMANYSEIDIDYYILKGLAGGRMPFLENYRVTNAVKDSAKKEYYLVLENDRHFQTIFIENSRPSKTMIINKATKQRHEIFLQNYYTSGETGFPRRIRILSPENRITVDIVFSRIRLNTVVSPGRIDSLRIPADVKRNIINN